MDRFLFPPPLPFPGIRENDYKYTVKTVKTENSCLKNQLLSLTINYLRYNLFILMTFIVKKLSTAIIIHFMNIL